MRIQLIIARYPKGFGWAGFLSMAWFRVMLWFNTSFSFWKLMGCGKNGTFDKTPDWQQWAVLLTGEADMPNWMNAWFRLFNARVWQLELEAIEGHGTWDHQTPFGDLPKNTDYDGPIAVLTRATIRLNRLKNFWQHVDAVAVQMAGAPGFITSVGIGEIPWIKQATFSIWHSKSAMRDFAYRMHEHKEVIRKTYQEQWYSEEMFVRFRLKRSTGSLNDSAVYTELTTVCH